MPSPNATTSGRDGQHLSKASYEFYTPDTETAKRNESLYEPRVAETYTSPRWLKSEGSSALWVSGMPKPCCPAIHLLDLPIADVF